MDTTRQVVRWTLPGAVFVIVAAVVGLVTCGPGRCGLEIAGIGEVAALAAASLPIGFLLYQAYFSGYQRARRVAVPLDRGQKILQGVMETGIDLASFAARSGWPLTNVDATTVEVGAWPVLGSYFRLPGADRDAQISYRDRAGQNMAAVLALMRSLPEGARPSAADLHGEYTSLSDIYHAQGASRTATLYATVVGLVLAGPLVNDVLWRDWAPRALAAAALGAGIFLGLHRARQHALNRLISSSTYGLSLALRSTETVPAG